jgi:putative ABC transport system permease protein
MPHALSLILLAFKQAVRHRTRSMLTILGVASAMFLFTAVETMQDSLRRFTQESADDTTLIVYRENRFCPAASRLPEHYSASIRELPGVREVIPVQIVVNNCGASLDVITFRGVPPENLIRFNPDMQVVAGSIDSWQSRGDGALVGKNFAARRALRPGDTFEAVGVRVFVAGIIDSPLAQDNNVAYVHLPFLQQASRSGLGIVTQFNVRVDSNDQLEAVAKAIDERFSTDTFRTNTRPEKAFFAQTAKDMIELISFTRWLGLGAVAVVVALVGNTLALIARSRVRESAVFQTLGYSRLAIGTLTMSEGVLLGLAGGMVGVVGAWWFFAWRRFTIGSEGITLAIEPQLTVALSAMVIVALLSALASAWPAFLAANRPIVTSLRTS